MRTLGVPTGDRIHDLVKECEQQNVAPKNGRGRPSAKKTAETLQQQQQQRTVLASAVGLSAPRLLRGESIEELIHHHRCGWSVRVVSPPEVIVGVCRCEYRPAHDRSQWSLWQLAASPQRRSFHCQCSVVFVISTTPSPGSVMHDLCAPCVQQHSKFSRHRRVLWKTDREWFASVKQRSFMSSLSKMKGQQTPNRNSKMKVEGVGVSRGFGLLADQLGAHCTRFSTCT